MDAQSGIYSEKKLAFYETTYKENILSKPQEINLTVTAAHLYGIAYICDQIGTREEDPEYTRFTCGIDEITKVYINNNNKNSPIYIQCDDTSKNVINRRRIILPSFGHKINEIVDTINNLKADYDAKLDKQKEAGAAQKQKQIDMQKAAEAEALAEKSQAYEEAVAEAKPVKEPTDYAKIRKAADDEFESMTADYKKPAPMVSKNADIINEDTPVLEAVFIETKNIPKSDYSSADIVNDMLGIDDILGAMEKDKKPAEDIFFETIDMTSADELLDTMPEEIVQKAPAEIEELVVPVIVDDEVPDAPVVTAPVIDEIEEVDTAKIIKQKLEEKEKKAAKLKQEAEPVSEPVAEEPVVETPVEEEAEIAEPVSIPEPTPAAKPVVEEIKNEPKPAAKEIKVAPAPAAEASKPAASLTLEEFETAVKKLKIMLDTGAITESEFACEKKKLLSTLY